MQGTGQAHHGLQTFDLRVQTLEPRSPTLDIAHHISRSPFTDQTLQPISHISSFTDQNSHLTHHTSDDSPNASPLKSQASRLAPDTSNLHITSLTLHLIPHCELFTPHNHVHPHTSQLTLRTSVWSIGLSVSGWALAVHSALRAFPLLFGGDPIEPLLLKQFR